MTTSTDSWRIFRARPSTWTLVFMLAWPRLVSAAEPRTAPPPTYEGVERQRIEAYHQGVAAAWAWRNELVRKGRLYPVSLHAWLAEAARIYAAEGEKAALEYCTRRRIKLDGTKIHVGVEHAKWFGKKQRAALEGLGEIVSESTPLGVELKLPIRAIQGLSTSKEVYFIRPIPEDIEVERLAKLGNVPFRGRVNWTAPNGETFEVVSGAAGVGFKAIGEHKTRSILNSYGCWIAEHHPDLEYAKYSVAYREENSLEDVINGLGHDPEISFLEPTAVVKLPEEDLPPTRAD